MKFVQRENFDRKIKLYENQNIAHNLAVFQNFGRKIQSWLF